MQVNSGQVGFIAVSDGWHNAEIVKEGMGFVQVKDEEGQPIEGETTDTLMIPFKVIEGKCEGGKAMLFCDLSKGAGQRKLGAAALYSGWSKKIAKKKGWKDLDAEDAGKDWDDKMFEKGHKFIDQAIVQLPSHLVGVKIFNSQGTDKKTNKPITFTNVVELRKYSNSTKPALADAPDETKAVDDAEDF